MFVLGELHTDHSLGWFLEFLTLWFFRESKLIKDTDEEKASLQKSISITSALLTEKDAELEKLRNEVEYLLGWTFSLPLSVQTPSLSFTAVFQVTVLRGENASAKSLHSVVQSLESDKVKLELKVKNLELQLKENKRQLSSSSGKTMTVWRPFPSPLLPVWSRCPPQAADVLHPAPPLSQPRAPHDPGPRRGAPALPTSDLPVVGSVGRRSMVDAGRHPRGSRGVWKCCGRGQAPVREWRWPLNSDRWGALLPAVSRPERQHLKGKGQHRRRSRGVQHGTGTRERVPRGASEKSTESGFLALALTVQWQRKRAIKKKKNPPPRFFFFLLSGNTDTQAEEDERAQESQVMFSPSALLTHYLKDRLIFWIGNTFLLPIMNVSFKH